MAVTEEVSAVTREHLLLAPLSELEAYYAEMPCGPLPRGAFRGQVLARLSTPGARRPLLRAVEGFGFEILPWGVDFTAEAWFFVRPTWRIGRFRPVLSRSRWRETEVVALHYDCSRLPGPIRRVLYDEVKPLSETLCLGLGGINRAVGQGDHFFFVLERLEAES